MMKKRLALLLFTAVFLCVAFFTAFAETPITVTLNGEKVSFDQPPIIMNDRTMVPMRAVFEAYGAEVYWVPETRTVFAAKGEKVLILTVDEITLECYDTKGLSTVEEFTQKISDWIFGNTDNEWAKLIPMDAVPTIVGDRTLIPLRAVSEALGAKVEWNGEERRVTMTGDTEPGSANKDKQFMNELIEWYKNH